MTEQSKQSTDVNPQFPDWGVYLQWPASDDLWVHPEDLTTAKELIPSNRVFRRSAWDGEYYQLSYGEIRLRVLPTMWVHLDGLDLDVGQQVELLSKQGQNDPGVFRIADMLYSDTTKSVVYRLRRDLLELEKLFTRNDLRPLRTHYNLRVGFYRHAAPKFTAFDRVDLLNVGDLFDEEDEKPAE